MAGLPFDDTSMEVAKHFMVNVYQDALRDLDLPREEQQAIEMLLKDLERRDDWTSLKQMHDEPLDRFYSVRPKKTEFKSGKPTPYFIGYSVGATLRLVQLDWLHKINPGIGESAWASLTPGKVIPKACVVDGLMLPQLMILKPDPNAGFDGLGEIITANKMFVDAAWGAVVHFCKAMELNDGIKERWLLTPKTYEQMSRKCIQATNHLVKQPKSAPIAVKGPSAVMVYAHARTMIHLQALQQ